ARTMASPFVIGPTAYLRLTPVMPAQSGTANAHGASSRDEGECPPKKFRRARTAAASAARWRDYDAAARTHFLRWVVSHRWRKASPTASGVVAAQLNAAKRTRVAMLPSVLPVLVVVTNRGDVPAQQTRPDDVVCQRCGTLDAQPYRPNPLRERVGIYLCRRHARISRARYADTAGVSLGLLHSSGNSNLPLPIVHAALFSEPT